MIAMAQALRTALLGFVWQGLVVALLLWIGLYLLRKRQPQARYAASCAALALLMALPVATGWLAYRAPSATAAGPIAVAITPAGDGAARANAKPAIDWAARFEPWALPLWSAGVLFFSLRLVWGCWRVSAMRRGGRPAETEIMTIIAALANRMGLSRTVRVLTAALPDGPSVVGWVRPVLLLPPAAVLGLSPEQLEAVLAHELAHIRRYDHLVNAAQTLVETLLFYHPAVWWTSARIREERELCCDDMAVKACGDALCFARALTKLERLRVVAPAPALGSTGGSLMYRVQRLVGANRRDCPPSKLSGILALSLGLASLMFNVHWAKGQEHPSQDRAFAVTFSPSQDGDAPGVTVDLGGATLLHRASVMYPEAARNSGIQGTVAVEVTLDGRGNVSDAHVVSGPMELRRSVMSSIFDWHFTPAQGGSTHVVTVMFAKGTAEDAKRNYIFLKTEPQRGEADVLSAEASQDVTLTLQNADGVLTVDDANSEERLAKLKGELDQERSRLENQPEVERSEAREHVRQLEAELWSAKTDSFSYRIPSDRESTPLTGRAIDEIEVIGLSEAARNDLLSQLPVHAGDTVTGPSLEGIGAAIRKFDEHLEWRMMVHEAGHASITIHAPGHEK